MVASKHNDGSWTIEEVGDVQPPPVDLPVVDCQVGALLSLISETGTNINGEFYTLVADKRNDGSWKIEEIGIVEESAAVNPKDRKWLLWGQLKAND